MQIIESALFYWGWTSVPFLQGAHNKTAEERSGKNRIRRINKRKKNVVVRAQKEIRIAKRDIFREAYL